MGLYSSCFQTAIPLRILKSTHFHCVCVFLSKLQIRGGKTCQEGKTRRLENFQLKIRTEFPVPALGRLEGGWGLLGVRILEPVRPPHFRFINCLSTHSVVSLGSLAPAH